MIPRCIHIPWFVLSLALFIDWTVSGGRSVFHGQWISLAFTMPLSAWLAALYAGKIR